MDRGAQFATVHGVAKSWTRLTDQTYSVSFYSASPKKLRGKNLCSDGISISPQLMDFIILFQI